MIERCLANIPQGNREVMVLMETLRWLRVIGDTVFAAGAVAFVVAVARLTWHRADAASGRPG